MDYRISRKGEELEIEGLTTAEDREGEIKRLLPGEWKGKDLAVSGNRRDLKTAPVTGENAELRIEKIAETGRWKADE